LVVDQTMNGLYNNYLLLAVPLFIFVANVMNASGVLDRLLAFAEAAVGRFRGGLAHVNIGTNLIFSGMSGSAVADAAGPGLLGARMMMRDARYTDGLGGAARAAGAAVDPDDLLRAQRQRLGLRPLPCRHRAGAGHGGAACGADRG